MRIRYKDPSDVVHVNGSIEGLKKPLHIALCERIANIDYWGSEQLVKTRKAPTCIMCLAFEASE